MTNLNIEGEIDEILGTLSDFYFHPTSDPTMAQVHGRAKQALIELVAKARVEELKKWRTMVQRLSEYVPNPESLIEFDDRIAALSSNKQGGSND